MDTTREIVINIAEVKLLWLCLGMIFGFIFCEIKNRQ
jgi:hypothetical protein